MTKDVVEIFTDGACKGNPGVGGWGALLRTKGKERELFGGEAHTTNNRMELMGAISALEALKRHLVENAPWGTTVEFFHEEHGDASSLDTETFAVEAWSTAFTEAFGTEPVLMGAGGSIPFIATFKELYPDAPILVIGTSDPTSWYHAPNESQDIGDLEKAALAEAIAFRLLAEGAK